MRIRPWGRGKVVYKTRPSPLLDPPKPKPIYRTSHKAPFCDDCRCTIHSSLFTGQFLGCTHLPRCWSKLFLTLLQPRAVHCLYQGRQNTNRGRLLSLRACFDSVINHNHCAAHRLTFMALENVFSGHQTRIIILFFSLTIIVVAIYSVSFPRGVDKILLFRRRHVPRHVSGCLIKCNAHS